MFAADAHHGYWSRCHFVFQVQAVCCAARSRLLFLTSPHPRHQMVLPSDSIVAAIKPINSMQAAPTRSMHPFLSCLCFVSRLKDSVYEVREKALVALRGTLTPPHSISFCSSSLSFCSHFALLQSRPEACFPGILSVATAGGHSCEWFRYPITLPRSLAFCRRTAAVKHAGKTSRLQYSVFSSCAQLWYISPIPARSPGLIALIESDPYDLSPSQVPILKALVKHAHKPPPISKIVGDALTTFWRNHREHWHTEVFALRRRLSLQLLNFAVLFQRHLISDCDFESELLEECRGKRSYYI